MSTINSAHSIAEQLASAKRQLQVSDSAALDSRLLMCQVLQCESVYLMTWPERELNTAQLLAFEQLVAQRKAGHPIAYLIGYRDFWSLRLQVSPATLIPRPETELLVETALALSLPEQAHVLDLGTGTGAIALALASEMPNWHVTGIDKSVDAVTLAKKNAQLNQLPQVTFKQSDWFAHVAQTRFSLIVSNPPYVEDDSVYLQQGDVRFEPASALTSGPDGLDDIRLICAKASSYLTPQGWLAFEHGHQQALGIQALLAAQGFSQIRSVNDLNGQPRITLGCLAV
ncbi:peptide chain release factor N(5)-glutamine methyltransferase [Paraglaciecola polaris]|uniref:Release factor glutamine methyltransferase n=1 Tax=Paraglaciecola polaris LMG 21857 TaxID=1129793 RepID=K6ZWT6_9ALTE|nr:peptide chain release factor N(5)-glutamine methyltransferase [Paraglaciecola polaris]GAC34712.1 methyltransferase [Paraglaciecola polaris LMG 21857]